MPIIYVDSGKETPLTPHEIGDFRYSYAYFRSADTQANSAVGQDFLVLNPGSEIFSFVLCDGVSQSYFGELAASYLGRGISKWLQVNRKMLSDPNAKENLQRYLDELSIWSASQISAHKIPANLPKMLQDVLEEKRVQGSQSMFAAGSISLPSDDYPEGYLYFAWMGDVSIRVFRGTHECSWILGNVFETNQRWSTSSGLDGESLNIFQGPINGLDRILVYSDGLGVLDEYSAPPEYSELNRTIVEQQTSPQSDDISYFELVIPGGNIDNQIAMNAVPGNIRVQVKGNRPSIWWDSIPEASFYQVSLLSDKERIYPTGSNALRLGEVPGASGAKYGVRTVFGLNPGEWRYAENVETIPDDAVRLERPVSRENLRLIITSTAIVLSLVVFGSLSYLAVKMLGNRISPEPTGIAELEIQPLSTSEENIFEPTLNPDFCYVVHWDAGVIVYDKPRGEALGFLDKDLMIYSVGEESKSLQRRPDALWLEVWFEGGIAWVPIKSTIDEEVYLERCIP